MSVVYRCYLHSVVGNMPQRTIHYQTVIHVGYTVPCDVIWLSKPDIPPLKYIPNGWLWHLLHTETILRKWKYAFKIFFQTNENIHMDVYLHLYLYSYLYIYRFVCMDGWIKLSSCWWLSAKTNAKKLPQSCATPWRPPIDILFDLNVICNMYHICMCIYVNVYTTSMMPFSIAH